MAHLAVLAANPGREIDAAELVAGTNALTGVASAQDQLDSEVRRTDADVRRFGRTRANRCGEGHTPCGEPAFVG